MDAYYKICFGINTQVVTRPEGGTTFCKFFEGIGISLFTLQRRWKQQLGHQLCWIWFCKTRDAGWEHRDGKQGRRSDCEVIKGPLKEQKKEKKCKEEKKNSNGL